LHYDQSIELQQEISAPHAMKAFILDRYEKTGSLRFGEMPEPELRDNDVLVEVHAAGVNVLDSKIRDGEFKLILPYRLPLILGNDVAGVVVRVGRKVRRFEAGDEVYARPAQEPGGQLISISGPPDVAFAKENGSNWLLQQVMRLSRASASAEKPGELASATRSFSCERTVSSYERSRRSSKPGSSVRFWTVSSHSKGQTTLWPTARQDDRKARSSSR
jgi:hypothetical protein